MYYRKCQQPQQQPPRSYIVQVPLPQQINEGLKKQIQDLKAQKQKEVNDLLTQKQKEMSDLRQQFSQKTKEKDERLRNLQQQLSQKTKEVSELRQQFIAKGEDIVCDLLEHIELLTTQNNELAAKIRDSNLDSLLRQNEGMRMETTKLKAEICRVQELGFGLDDNEITTYKNGFGMPDSLGNGGSCYVAKGRLNRTIDIALKRFYDNICEEIILHEVSIIQTLRHPNIIRFVGFNLKMKSIALELAENKDLHHQIRHGTVTLANRGIPIMLGIVEGLAYLHSMGFIHLDLKSANVLLDKDWTPKLSDFGLSRRIDDDCSSLVTEHDKFSAAYSPPEAFESPIRVSVKSDVYGLGCIGYEIATGNAPWHATPRNQIVPLVKEGKRPQIPSSVPKVVSDLILETWHQDPKSRIDIPTLKRIISSLLYK